MKIGINAWTFPPNISIPQGLRIAKRAGFDAVELNISEDEYLRPDMSNDDIAAFSVAARNISLELRSVSSGLWWKYALTSPDPENAETAKSLVKRGLEICKILGADTLLVVPGVVNQSVRYDEAYDRALAALKELSRDAERLKVYIGVENVWNKFLLSPLETRDFIDAVGSSYVQAYFDVGNVLLTGFPEHWIDILGSRIRKVHVKDFQRSPGVFVNLLQGDVDWIGVRNALRGIGYDDTVTAEIGGYKTLPDLGIRHAGESLRRVFKGTGPQKAGAREDASEGD